MNVPLNPECSAQGANALGPSLQPADAALATTAPGTDAMLTTLDRSASTAGQCFSLLSGLKLNPNWPLAVSPQWQSISDVASLLQVEIRLDAAAQQRLRDLWSAVNALGADEIGDWVLPTGCVVRSSSDKPAPAVLGVGATVYADRSISLYVQFADLDVPLWLDITVELDDLNSSAASCDGRDRHG